MFEIKLVNGEIVKRSWLVYSESTGRVFVGACKLYGGTSVFGLPRLDLMTGKILT